MSKQTYSTFAEKVALFRKGKSASAVVMQSVPRNTKLGSFPATICPDGFPQLVAAFSPKQVTMYEGMGYAVYKEEKPAAVLATTKKAKADE